MDQKLQAQILELQAGAAQKAQLEAIHAQLVVQRQDHDGGAQNLLLPAAACGALLALAGVALGRFLGAPR